MFNGAKNREESTSDGLELYQTTLLKAGFTTFFSYHLPLSLLQGVVLFEADY